MQLTRLLALLALGWAALFEIAIWGHTPGLGWLIFFAATICGVALLRVRLERAASSWVWLLWLLPLACAYAMVCYDADLVQGLGPCLFIVSWSVAVCWSLMPDAPLESFRRPLPGVWWMAWPLAPLAGVGAFLKMCPAEADGERSQQLRKVALGMLGALPFVLLFGWLFASADPAYSNFLSRLGDWCNGELGASLLRIGLFTAWGLGFLALLTLHGATAPAAGRTPIAADATIIGALLGTVNALFATFLSVQARYLFDYRHALTMPGVTYATYARQGFFELAWVTVIVLALVWGCYRALFGAGGNAVALGLCAVLILQTFGVAASALQRMHAYEVEFGLTLLRFYVTLAIVGMGVLLKLVLVAVVRRLPPAWLASRIFMASWLLLAGTVMLDADGSIARVNLSLPRGDAGYVASLSLDVVPYLSLSDERTDLRAAMLERASHVERGWASYNLSRRAAQVRLSTTATGR
jgi:hypothetical protein